MKIYLDCPYHQRNIAKENGAIWDKNFHLWYCIDVVPNELSEFVRAKNNNRCKTHTCDDTKQHVLECSCKGCKSWKQDPYNYCNARSKENWCK